LHYVHEGQAHAIGEVGRPHWEVSEAIWDLSNMLLEETMHLAAQEKIPLQLHVEGESELTYPDLAQRAVRQGMELQKLVRHYSPPDVRAENTHGLTPSVLCGQGALERLMETHAASSHGFFMETDYMDDPRRPGAVLGPKTVPKRTRQLLEAGLPEEVMWHTHQTLPLKVYGPLQDE
jgi:TatD-related deoxyribonuclease